MKLLILNTFLLASLCLFQTSASLAQGTQTGGGGDACDERIDSIRKDLLSWVNRGGGKGLRYLEKTGNTLEQYNSKMAAVLADKAVVLSCVKPTRKHPNPVKVRGEPKSCKGFRSPKDHLLHIRCDFDRFYLSTPEDAQYRIIHHEFAGLKGIEKNDGAISDYILSDQITKFLRRSNELKLAIVPELMPQWIYVTYHSSDYYERKAKEFLFALVKGDFKFLEAHTRIRLYTWLKTTGVNLIRSHVALHSTGRFLFSTVRHSSLTHPAEDIEIYDKESKVLLFRLEMEIDPVSPNPATWYEDDNRWFSGFIEVRDGYQMIDSFDASFF